MGGEGDELGVEGASGPQGRAHRIYSQRASSNLVIAILLVFIFAGRGQAGLFDNKKQIKPHTYQSVESANLSRRIKQLICELEYSDKVAEDFVGMVNSWQNSKTAPFFAIRREKLHQAREDYKQGKVDISDVAVAEENIAEEISWLIKNKLDSTDEDFELADVIKAKQANCLGCTQIFYILGDSIGLSVIPINVVELQSPGPLPTGAAHVSCIVNLSDGRTIMLNLVPGGFVSKPFVMEEKFVKIGNYLRLRDKSNCLNIYRKIQLLDKDGLIAYIYSNRGNGYASAGRFNKSIHDYVKAIELNPNFAEAYNNRGIAYRNLGRLKQAIADYTKAVELNPNYAGAYNNRGIAYGKMDQFYLGICDYNKAIELNPKFAEAYNNRATAYVKLGRFDRAISDYTRAIKSDSRLAKAYGNRAITYALLGEPERARKDSLKAIELNPDLKGQITVLSKHFKLDAGLD